MPPKPSRAIVYELLLFLFKAEATAGMLFGFTLALSFASKTRRKRLFGYRLPLTVNMDAHFPVQLAKAVIAAFEVEMVGKIHNNVDAELRVVNELHTLLFVTIPVCRSMRGRSMSVRRARSCANRQALARDKRERRAN